MCFGGQCLPDYGDDKTTPEYIRRGKLDKIGIEVGKSMRGSYQDINSIKKDLEKAKYDSTENHVRALIGGILKGLQ